MNELLDCFLSVQGKTSSNKMLFLNFIKSARLEFLATTFLMTTTTSKPQVHMTVVLESV